MQLGGPLTASFEGQLRSAIPISRLRKEQAQVVNIDRREMAEPFDEAHSRPNGLLLIL